MDNDIKLKIEVDKKRIYRALDVKPESPVYGYVEEEYDHILNMLPDLVSFKFDYELKENINSNIYKKFSRTSHVVYCIISLGNELNLKCESYFKEANFLEGALLSVVGDQVLFNASKQLYEIIKNDMESKGYKLTRRIEPGSSLLGVEVQSDVLKELKAQERLGISITETYMYNPIKTMGYIYGADKNIKGDGIDHDCSTCKNVNCKYRNVASK